MKQPQLGTCIAELRNQKGLTQKELAEACKVDIRTIQRIESGEVLPRIYTIRLLAKVLETDISEFIDREKKENAGLNKQLSWSFIAGIIFCINYIPVIAQIIANPFGKIWYGSLITIHVLTCILFFRGFYLLGKQFNNQLMAIPSLLSMILLPLLNIMDLLKGPYLNFTSLSTIFTVVCMNSMIYGIGLWVESGKKTNARNYYRLAGLSTIIQSGLFLGGSLSIINAGLILSAFCNVFMVIILYREGRNLSHQYEGSELFPSIA